MILKKKFIGKASGKLIATMSNRGGQQWKNISLRKITIYEQNLNLCYDSFVYQQCCWHHQTETWEEEEKLE